ncbi:MAG: alanine--tRNA ligase [Candidatus Saelkia tenebricola]|nr:alanine--tRNA ligase [Candidatus Saelkia tenebricola]
MKTDQIRMSFLDFFASKGHKIFPSDFLAPSGDKTVLFTSAGMNQFKPYFLGTKKDVLRAASSQKCLRTDDLTKVGKTSSHHTFFEMLGNFSFGDYFKEEAISWGWEFISDVVGLDESRIWVSVYMDDDEAYRIWTDKVKVHKKRIVKLGADKNFWPGNAIEDGPNGPCGPCSEIFYDLGKDVGCGNSGCNPNCDCGRFVEIWNLVFTQFNRKEKNGKGVLEPLPNKNIDTGMGLERMASVIQNVKTNFEIDIFKPIVSEILSLIGKSDGSKTIHINAIADHIRAVSFAITDGIFPSNEERGYVIRKIIRKAAWHGYKLGMEELFLYKIVPSIAAVMKQAYPELEKKRENISQIIKSEEERFQNTLDVGLVRLHDLMNDEKKRNQNILPGDKVFQLYDTYGFPYELSAEIAYDEGFEIDSEGFQKAMDDQRQRSKGGSNLLDSVFLMKDKELLGDLPETKFLGYDLSEAESTVLAVFDVALTEKLSNFNAPGDAVIVVDKSPFYAESGGQAADKGEISNRGFRASVSDVQIREGRILHFVKVHEGRLEVNNKVNLKINIEERLDTARNHTATHLLQAALRKILGEHIEQSGSYVGPDRLRFDFTHFNALSSEEIICLEKLVNEYIMRNREVKTRIVSFDMAKKEGALAFFTEKYQDEVKVVEVADCSKELCGGTHVNSTGEIGFFKIISEVSSASGVRRIEAVTGRVAFEYVKDQEDLLKDVSSVLGVSRDRILSQIEEMRERLKEQSQFMQGQKYIQISDYIEKLKAKSVKIKGINFITDRFNEKVDFLADLIDRVKIDMIQNTVVVLYSIGDKNLKLFIGITDDLVNNGLDARVLVKGVASLIDGAGGGRADFAQAGGRNVSNMDRVVEKIKKEIKAELK